MTITAKIIADSFCGFDLGPGYECEDQARITTFQLRYPRFIHAELMTHRVFSRNASSSRAIPVKLIIKDILEDTAMPSHWGKNKSGMQADGECSEPVWNYRFEAAPNGYNSLWHEPVMHPHTREEAWFAARDHAIELATAYDKAGYHKQIVNRLLEPFSHISVIVTATEYDNWFELRDHPDAQPEIEILAKAMKAEMNVSKPIYRKAGEWHLPYITPDDRMRAQQRATGMGLEPIELLRRVSAARCARVSYLTHDNETPSIEKDLELFDRLVSGVPLHASPIEHQATPLHTDSVPKHPYTGVSVFGTSKYTGNFDGWMQYRKFWEEKIAINQQTKG